MTDTAFEAAASATSVDRAGQTAWTNPTNALTDDANVAEAVVPTDYLCIGNFPFSIPTDATINGITVRVEADESGAGSSNYILQLFTDATPTFIGSGKGPITVTGTTPVVVDTGGTADTWGASLTPTIVNDNGFGVALWSTDTTNTLRIDYVFMRVSYTEAPAPAKKLAALGVG